ncbi:MAG TPA: hypothetical protein GXX29_01045 [Firmicutes bacterium]|nr:hypothetical protein [Bacillota bacterium]
MKPPGIRHTWTYDEETWLEVDYQVYLLATSPTSAWRQYLLQGVIERGTKARFYRLSVRNDQAVSPIQLGKVIYGGTYRHQQ